MHCLSLLFSIFALSSAVDSTLHNDERCYVVHTNCCRDGSCEIRNQQWRIGRDDIASCPRSGQRLQQTFCASDGATKKRSLCDAIRLTRSPAMEPTKHTKYNARWSEYADPKDLIQDTSSQLERQAGNHVVTGFRESFTAEEQHEHWCPSRDKMKTTIDTVEFEIRCDQRFRGEYNIDTNSVKSCFLACKTDKFCQGIAWNPKTKTCTAVRELDSQRVSAVGSIAFIVHNTQANMLRSHREEINRELEDGTLAEKGEPERLGKEELRSRGALQTSNEPPCYNATWKTMCVNECSFDELIVNSVEYVKACSTRIQHTQRYTTTKYSGPLLCAAAECNNRSDCLGVGWVQRSRVCHLHLLSNTQASAVYYRIEHFLFKKTLAATLDMSTVNFAQERT